MRQAIGTAFVVLALTLGIGGCELLRGMGEAQKMRACADYMLKCKSANNGVCSCSTR